MKQKVVVKKRPPFPATEIPADAGAIISFDVGIVNLAYCILSEGFTVYDWNIINLADGDSKLKCGRNTVAGKKCGKKAHYIHEQIGICRAHGSPSMRRNITVESATETELKETLFRQLDANPLFLQVSTVVIEHQPIKAREKIKGIGHAIYDYYVLRRIIDKQLPVEIKFIDAKNKLTIYDGPVIECGLKTQYARNKWYSIRYCAWALRTDPRLVKFMEGFKKKDDLADCFLQGAWYLKYGQHGKRAEISPQQEHVFRDMNLRKYKVARPRAPIKKQYETGKFTLCNIKWLLSKPAAVQQVKEKLEESLMFYFGTKELNAIS
jgi:hypothetical protein